MVQTTITDKVTYSQDLSETISKTVNVDNQPPVFTGFIIERQEIIIGNTADISCSAADADNQPLSYEWFTDTGSFISVQDTQVAWQSPQTPSKCRIPDSR